ncbi:non-ribosomal peptide synthase/polyketide synthase, partial [Corallococcus sp. RDP092CA]|uniref:non-ribosomal peptide synthase/polyketide synthase n=1 Tax=Corallococcus sp. RDP092CA TaxID=3109369 RepID=UPI0035AEBB74
MSRSLELTPSQSTLVDVLRSRAEARSEQPLYTFLDDAGQEDGTLSYAGLDARARRIAVALRAVAKPGERVMLLYPPGLEYVAGFFGCLYAGLIAVPAYPPDPMRLERTLPRLRAIIQDADATVVLTTSGILGMTEFVFEQAPDLRSLHWVATDELPVGGEVDWAPPAVDAATLAFLQYTSGSTGSPKGVMLSHGNLAHNLALISDAFQLDATSSGVIWLPPYHDMGLIGGILTPLYATFHAALMSPLTMLKNPRVWLEAVTRYKATVSGGPNFAFDLCVRRIPAEDRQTLDLGSWRVAFTGAEPIRPATLERFEQAFGPHGFKREFFYPCYGLAEATLLVSGGRVEAPPVRCALDAPALEQRRAVLVDAAKPEARVLVGCGEQRPGHPVVIVDPQTREACAPGGVGEIWVRGPSVAQGYWNKPEATAEAFQARVKGTDEGPFLRTGDLGFLRDGELFVTGRAKDLIIIRGRNHYPQDIEQTVEESHPALRAGSVAAVSLEVAGEERLVVVQEIDLRKAGNLRKQVDMAEAAVKEIRQRVAERHEVQVHAVALIEPGSIPKTSSGKIQRHACKAQFLTDELRTVLVWREPGFEEAEETEPTASAAPVAAPVREDVPEPVRATLAWLVERVAEQLKVPAKTVDVREPITRYGLDSLSAVELAHAVEKGLGTALPMELLLQGPSLVELAKRIAASKQDATKAAVLAPGPRGATQPLSFAQQRLWFLDRLEQGSALYSIPGAVRLDGALDAESLRRSLEEIVRRHESLRTTFHEENGEAVQLIHPAKAFELPVVDLTGFPEASREAEARRCVDEEAVRPFDLGAGPLVRARLLKLGEAKHVLLVTMHHIVSDGWSMGVLVREVAALYDAFRAGRGSPLPELRVQYADFAQWQREWLLGGVLEKQVGYWKQRLAGAPALLELPTDFARPAAQTYRGATVPVKVGAELSRALGALAKQEGVTPYMLLLAAFQVLLGRYSGQEDLSVGSPITGRTRAETEGLIGFFVNTLVLRTNLEGNPSFRALLAQVKETTLGAYAHQDVPFEKLVEELQPQRSLSHAPLFQVMFVLQQDVLPHFRLPGVELSPYEVESKTAKFDLTLYLTETANGLEGTLEYNTDLFEAATARRMTEHLRGLLESLVSNPGGKLSELPLMGPQEQQALLRDVSGTDLAGPVTGTMQGLFEAQAARTPDAPAVLFDGAALTYAQLDTQANQLAHHLRGMGVGPDTLVGVSLERSARMVVALLGVLKAGGAYVPLDPAYPRERLGWMLEDAQASVLLTQQKLLGVLPEHAARSVCLDTDWETIARNPASRVDAGTGVGNLAYVLYTSGSTGRPKGVAIEQRSAVAFLHWATAAFTPEQLAGVLAATSLNFDLSVFEVFAPLSSGGAVIVAENVLALPTLKDAGRVTLVNTVPSAMAELVRGQGVPESVRTVNLAGEPLLNRLAQALYGLKGVEGVYNLYGPTEDTTYSTYSRVERDAGREPTIGRPLTGSRAYVLDAWMRPVPRGVPGELYLAGAGLARGYLARPSLTAERFVPNPFSAQPGARMYRTGDRVRWLATGELEYLGRIDFQVKVRGFRIELGEVESALSSQAGVRESVVVVREDVPGDKRLVAYVAGVSLDVAELRAGLKQRLPEYMVPSAFVVLDALPLTPNGKVDRKALPVPEGPSQARYVAPRTATEEQVATLFAQLLRVERVGAEDSFFELGGHSLLAMQLVSRLRAAFGVEVPLRSLFELNTVASLATFIDGRRQQAGAASLPPLERRARGGAQPLSFAQQRLWFLDRLEQGSALYNVPGAVRLDGELDVEALRLTLQEIVARHESLRTTFREDNGQAVQIIHAASRMELPVVELSSVDEADREAETQRRVDEEALRPFELSTGPLVRARLLKLGEAKHVLVVTMHHIVSDGWSLGVLVREMAALYEAFATGRTPSLPELSVQYADFAQWQREWLLGGALEEQVGYWKQRLAGAPALLELPTDFARPAVQTYRGATVPVKVGAELSRALGALAKQEGVTPYMLLLAAFQVLLSRYSGQDDVSVGSPIAGRTRAETEGLIGFFVNTLVLRTKLSGDPSFQEVLRQVKETTLGAYAHQDVPFEKLVEELQPQRSLSHAPLFQVMFALQQDVLPHLKLSGVELSPYEVEAKTAKFDLTLSLTETASGLEGTLEYNTDLFEAATARRMTEHLRVLLESVVVRPMAKVSQFALMGAQEQQALLKDVSGTDLPGPVSGTMQALFEAQAARTPDAPAVLFDGESLTYAQLDAQANQLAHHLRGMGVGPDTLVGVSLERSSRMVVALLGVLKAGGAYVPLDPAYPRERLGWMLEDAQAPVLLTQQKLLGVLPEHSARNVFLDTDWENLSKNPASPVDARTGVRNLAYVLYTSGSTGRPKGVAIEQRSVVAFLRWATTFFTPQQLAGVLASTSLNFDISVFEIFAPLSVGGAVIVAENALALPTLKDASRVTLLNTVPSAMAELVRSQGVPESVRTVNLAGEPLLNRLVQAVYGLKNVESVYNLYGPTEDTTYSTYLRVEKGAAREPTVGRPLTGSRGFVLDAWLRPVPQGVPGELYIAGAGLARGYLARPSLTAERFIPNPFSQEPGARMYRTGDRVRWLATGELEYLGRIDFQVKVRGFRIELGEVESVLSSQAGVRESVVVVREDVPGDKRLVAYVAGASLDVAELRKGLKSRLPEYMVPSAFVVLDALPLNPNGKVDRKSLPVPEAQSAQGQYVAPRTATEEQVATLFAQLLRVERVGAEDSFFELGGHSLLAMQLVSRLRAAFGVELPVRAIFESPSVATLAAAVDMAISGRDASDAPAITPRPRSAAEPLSFAQQRLWFLDQLEQGSAFYNVAGGVKLDGALHVEAMRRALEEIVRRHESLRTTFRGEDGQAVQVVHTAKAFELPVVEVSGAQDAEARRLAEEEAARPFDLGTGPLFRAKLLKLGEAKHVLLVTMHHIVSDGWSLGVLVREVAALYEAQVLNQQSPLPELSVQYADFAQWQREWLLGGALEEQVGYWKQRLAGAPALLELPTDFARPAVQMYRGATVPVKVGAELSRALGALAKQEGVTPYMLLLAAFQVLLSRYSGQDDISVGSPIAGRTRAETEGLIGFFVNTLVLRTKLSGDPSFQEVLRQVKETTLGAYAHQDVPFEKLVEELQPQRSLSHAPLFQVMFALQQDVLPHLKLSGVELSPYEVEAKTAKFDLTLSLTETASGLEGTLEYNTDLFEAATARRMTEHLRVLLESVVVRPMAKVSQFALMGAQERHQVLVAWNDTRGELAGDVTFPALFEAQVRRAPDAQALVFEEASLTYARLDARANQLAHHLRTLGVGPEVRVALCVERSLDLAVAMLGIQKAGGAFVPLDPSYPRERLSFMLEDSGAPVLVTQDSLSQQLPAEGRRVVRMDVDAAHLQTLPESAPVSGASADSLAYVIYTSGSTGRPKGTLLPHRGLNNTARQAAEAKGLGTGRRVLQYAASSFDASVWEVFSTLVSGATLVLAPRDRLLPDEPLRTLLKAQRISTVTLTPSVLAQLSTDGLEGLSTIVSAGEALSVELARKWGQGRTLINAYGPTETTVCATLTHGGVRAERLTIGRPLANVRVYVLDAQHHPVPVGVPGELYVAGEGLARGYQGRPDMTADKFVPDPFSPAPGARLYRTGDRVRWLPEGELEYLGRIDHQVKVRGFRIELGEIEAVLLRHADVREAVAVVREDVPGDKRLVGYVVPQPERTVDAASLRKHLKDGVPEYMVPSAFVVLGALPMTPAGKVDRKALPAPSGALTRPDAYVAPRTTTEARVAALFARVLTVERVGAEDSFFELGGHSLMATQLVSRLRGEFQVELPLRALFESPTVAALAARVDEAPGAERKFKTPPLQPAPRDGALPLSFDQERLWLFEQLTPGTPIYNVPSAARLSGDLDAEVLRRGLEEIVRRHEALRTVFRQDASGAPTQVILPAKPFVLPLVDLSSLPAAQAEAEARKQLNAEAARPFDLVEGPLLRAQLLRLSAREHVLCLVQHHIVVDGWAVGVFMHELQALYTAFLRGEPSPLPALPVQYADYTLWHRQWLSGDVLEQQIAWWKQQLAGAPRIALRTDAPRPAGDRFHGDSRRFHLPPDLTARIEALGRGEGATLFMVLLAAFDALLHRRTGQDDIVVGTDIANRAREELESLVGFFTNQLVLRTQVTGDLSFRALLERVRKGTLDAYEHQDLPFGTLVQALKPPREPGGQLFNVKFVLENAPLPPLQLPGLELSLLDAETNGTAKWDLLVVVFPWQGGLTVTVEHNTDVLDRASVERLFAHFESLLRAVVDDPERRIGTLPLLTRDERDTLAAWNDRPRTYPHGQPVSRIFEAQAARAPDAVAVSFEGEALTAARLNARANQLAHHLRALGVRPGKRVGVCLERSLDLVVAVLGIAKAGGAYVPLDPSFPTERLSLLIEDAGLSALVSVSALADELPAQWLQVVCLDDDAAALAKRPDANLDTAPAGEDELYVLYTSGSTGRPKGVSVPHRAVVRLVCGPEWVSLSSKEVFLQLAPLAFDASTFEVWGALLNGAKLAVFPPRAPTLDELGQVIAREGVSTLWLTAGLFHQMVDGNLEGLRPVRQLLAGGDVLSPAHVLRVMEELPGCRVINGYGPTENTTFTACYPVEGAGALGGSVPIGRPINGTRVHVLNASLEPVPLGAPGELFAGGDGLAHGYLNQPELTAEKFIPDPFSTAPGARLYRTGDQVRFRADGALEFLGRIDQQVKVRGFRIEPGEIETVLRGHPSVLDVTVAVQEVAGEKALVAYVVTEEGAEPLGVDTMRAFLHDKLPAYMVPTALMALDALPLTPNGKVDRRALPVPGSERPQMATEYAAPRTPEETALCEVWAEVLGVERVGIDDSFYDLGGDSIRSIQLIAKLRERGLDLPMMELLRQPTIRALGNLVQAAPSKAAGQAVPGSEPFSLLSDADRARLPADVEDAYPVAVLQAGMLFQSQLDQASGMYHDATSYHLEMALDEAKLRQLLAELARRHSLLRTSFDLTGYEQPLQLVHREAQVPLSIHDVRHVPASEQDALLRRLVEEDRCRPFDWSRAPLLRFALYRRTEKTLQFSLIFHHAILDGWSLATLLSELFRGYVNLLRGTPAPEAAPLAVTYRQFVALEHQSLTSGEGERFWKSRLAEVDRPAPRAPLPEGQAPVLSMRQLDVPAALQEGLQRVAQVAGVPLKTVLLAAHLRVRALMEGRRSVVTGVVANGRPETADSERMVGLFLNSIPFPVTLEDGTWLDLVRQVSKADADIWPHRRYPMGRLQQQLGGQRLFDNLFNFVHFHVAGGLSQLEGVRLLEETPSTAWMELPLSTLFLQRPDTGALMLVLRTNGTQRDADQTEALAGYYFRALEAMAAYPHSRHERALLLPDAERQKLLVEWNATDAAPADDTCVHERFAAHAARTPDAVAVVCDDGRLTYGELNRRANQLAHWLRARGVGPDARVGLLTERTPDAIVGMMGILKAGGAYVPLEPSHPAERLCTVLEDAAASLVVTQASLAASVADASRGHVCLDTDAAMLAREREDTPARLGDSSSLAYVIFTSGSTGRPKGVAVEHRQLNHYVDGVTLRLELPPAASFASVSTLAADLGHTAVFPTLSGGGTLHLISKERATDPAALGDYFQRHAVDCLKIVPSHLTALLASPSPERVLPRKRLVLGGEASDPALVARVHALAPGLEVFNHYGPTETTVGVLTWKVARGTQLAATASVPLGRPLPNARMYVLDAAMQPVPVGVPGELFIGGAGVARGYLGQPGLTMERFLADPFHPVPGARVYRTGDRVRYLPDGALEFLGRVDFQVKVRGFRIELPEVEAAMSGLPGVAEVVVLAREDVPGDKRLVAYVVAVPGHTLDAGALRQGLKSRLPDYMMPSAFVMLAALPLTSNGKVDRRALPAPEQDASDARPVYVAPRTPTEELLAALWSRLIGVERVGAHDNFFELGGHSLLAMQVASRIREAFGVELPLRMLFEAPSVAELARRVDVLVAQGRGVQAPPLVALTRAERMPLSFAQQRLWFLNQLEPDSAFYSMPLSVRLDGTVDVAALEQAFTELVRRHESLRTTFPTREGQPAQVVHSPAPFSVTKVDLSGVPEAQREAEASRQANEEAQRPFRLDTGPLLRVKLFKLSAEQHVMLVTMHHIVSDGWSLGVLVREMAALYEAFATGRTPSLPELPVQYADYAGWQRDWLQGDVLARQLGYWKQQLTGAPSALELPTDRPRPAVQTYRGASIQFRMGRQATEALKALALKEGVTPFMVLLTAWQVLLSRYSGQDDVTVGTPIAGRGRTETEGLIGFFVNTLVLRAKLGGNPSFRELLAQVRETTLSAYAHQDVPFEKLVEELAPTRDTSRTPLFQVLLSFRGAPVPELKVPGLTLRAVPLEHRTAQFDLNMTHSEVDGELRGAMEYNSDLFDASTAERMLSHLAVLLEGVAASPDAPIQRLPLLTEGERKQLLETWNDTRADFPREACIHQRFEAQVELAPDAVAATFEGEQLTYRQLDAKANQLAHHLRRLGVGPEVKVALCLERSLEMVIGVLGVLKAGGAYVPLDPKYPLDRLSFMLEDTQVPVVLTQDALADELPVTTQQLISLDGDWERSIAREREDAPVTTVGAGNLAYVIYTSGSTGKPKGVAIEHRGVSNY